MLRCLAGAIASLLVVVAAHAQVQAVDPMFDASVLRGTIGDTTVSLYLAPSPHIARAAGDFISSAQRTLDVCVYEVNLPMILGRLNDAVQRGVRVRLAVPPDEKPNPYEETLYELFTALERADAIRYTQNRSGLMHNKFMVADGQFVWTGSYNLTVNDTQFNDNNAITLSNRLLAANYTAEFEEIWAGRHGRKGPPTPFPTVNLGTTVVRNAFSPEDDMEGMIVEEIGKATNSIYIMAFGMSDDEIFLALSNRIAAGVAVYALFDTELARQKSSLSHPLREAGATVRISSNNGQMHHKVMVIDQDVVITGSPNFSKSAFEGNDENVLIFACPPLARAFTREFARCWQAKPYITSKWSQPIR